MSSDLPIMTIREMIEAAFGDEDNLYVNFKLTETVLMVLAKQLNVLNRQVLIQNNTTARLRDKAILTVSEVKIREANLKKKPKSSSSFGDKTIIKSANGGSPETSSFSLKGPSTNDKRAKASGKILSNSDDAESMEDIADKKITSTSEVFKSKKYFEGVLGKIEEQREKVLRIIHQRADSHDEGAISPIPIAPLLSAEMEHEKLFVVEKVTQEEAAIRGKISKSAQRRPSHLYVVPQDEFLTLAQAVADLQTIFHKYEAPEFPSNMQLMLELRSNKSSLTDAMSVLQISARLEACEKAIKSMIEMLTELAKRPIHGNIQESFHEFVNQLEKNQKQQKSGPGVTESRKTAGHQTFYESVKPSEHRIASPEYTRTTHVVTLEQLNIIMKQLQDDIQNTFGTAINRAETNLTKAMNIARRAEEKTEQAIRLEPEIRNLQIEMKNCTEHVNALDILLSSQLANYQEQLTQMEYNLETGLEHLQDTLAIRGGDTEAMSELHAQFANLKSDLDDTKTTQKQLEKILAEISLDILRLRGDIETLCDTKSDRDEVVDALQDKAGLKDLNGMVDVETFGAVIGDLENRISEFYKRTHAQELEWQKIIDDFTNQISMKGDWIDVVRLRDDINKNLEILKKKVHAMADILGEPNAAAVTRKLQRDSACLSCATPAVISPEEQRVLPALPALKPTQTGTKLNESKPKGGDDHETCYCGQPIPHQKKNSRFELINRFCGGEHTRTPYVRTRIPREIHVKSVNREVDITQGSDGKFYNVDKEVPSKPIPCNTVRPSKRDIPAKESKVATEGSDDVTVPSDFNALRIFGWNSGNSYRDASRILGQDNTSESMIKTCYITIQESITPAEPYFKVSSRDVGHGHPSTPTVSSDHQIKAIPLTDPIDVSKDVEPPVTLDLGEALLEDQSIVHIAASPEQSVDN